MLNSSNVSDVLVVGTVAFDTIKTPFGRVEKVLGGSATYASFGARFFSKPAVISIVGDDFPKEHIELMNKSGISTDGLQRRGKTFHWEGFYDYDMNEAKTIKTEINSLENFKVKIPEQYKKIKYVFLANIDPELQIETLNKMNKPDLVVMDTMNFWIENKRKALQEVIKKVDVLLINDGEARQFFNTTNLVKSANKALSLGPRAVIIKKGEHGALLFTKNKHFSSPSYPLEIIKDPTGCGDSFGGGFIGYLTKTKDLSEKNFRKAIVFGSVIASYNAENFGTIRLQNLTMNEIKRRYKELRDIREF